MNTNKSKPRYEFSVVVTAHTEGLLLWPTLNAIAISLQALIDRKISCEVVIILDKADEHTTQVAQKWEKANLSFFPISLNAVDLGESGASRNAGIAFSKGKIICVCDGDDLPSSNYFLSGYNSLAETDEEIVFHPEYVLSFGSFPSIWKVRGFSDPSTSYKDLIEQNLWPSSSISSRTTYLNHPYPSLPPSSGFGPEDWAWNIQTTISGAHHEVLKETAFCYRTKSSGGVNNQHRNSLLPSFDYQELKRKFDVKNSSHNTNKPEGKISTKLLRKSYKLLKPFAKKTLSFLSPEVHGALYRSIAKPYRAFNKIYDQSVLTISPNVKNLFLELSKIDPSISWSAYRANQLESWEPKHTGYTDILFFILERIAEKSKALVFAPWIGIGGADLVTLNYIKALNEISGYRNKISTIATYLPEKTVHNLIPYEANFMQMPEGFRNLSQDDQKRLIAQMVILESPQLILSINCFDITSALQRYSKQMCLNSDVYLSLFAFDSIGDGLPVNPITDDPERYFLNQITKIITDNNVTKNQVVQMLGIDPNKVISHKQPGFEVTPKFRKYTAAYNDWEFSSDYPFKLIWPHRIDKEKRPEVLLRIAEECENRNLPIEITIYGQTVLKKQGQTSLDELLSNKLIKYGGPYSGGMSKLPTRKFHSFLLTSESEGLPIAIIQSMMLGLPIISSSVGGITDLITDGYNGLLTNGPDDIFGFVECIENLLNSRTLRREIIENAYVSAVENHSWEVFVKSVDIDFSNNKKEKKSIAI